MRFEFQPVLLVEDHPDEARILNMAWKRAGIKNPLVNLTHGAEAVAYLSNRSHPRPCLVITDIKMPWMDGFELLQWVTRNCSEADFPVLVLTSSPNPIDEEQAYNFGAADFYLKPAEFGDTIALLKQISRRWIARSAEPKPAAELADLGM